MKSFLVSLLISFWLSLVFGFQPTLIFASDWESDSEQIAEGEVFVIPELGALILTHDGKFIVEMEGMAQHRLTAYRNVDLRKGDVIVMLNGSRVKSLTQLEEGYSVISPEELVKLGISRDGKMMIVSFPKADASELPQRRMIVIPGDGTDDLKVYDGKGASVLKIASSDVAILMGAGLIIGPEGDKLIVNSILPHAEEIDGLKDVQIGDVVEAINGVTFSSPTDLSDYWQGISVGEDVILIVSRGGTNQTLKFKKPDASAKPMIIRTKPGNK